MTYCKLKEFGPILTGREYGKTVYNTIKTKLKSPAGLDFEGVESMGSSFGDEIVVPIAERQKKRVAVKNANTVVASCLMDIAEENGIVLDFQD